MRKLPAERNSVPICHNVSVAKRVHNLYGQPSFETWAKIARALRLAPGSAWSLAHGLRKPTMRVLEYLECAEWRLDRLEQATANIMWLIGKQPVLPTVFRRHND